MFRNAKVVEDLSFIDCWELKERDLECLSPDRLKKTAQRSEPVGWLNDNVINFFIQMIATSNKQCAVMSSHFHSKIANTYDYNCIKNWSLTWNMETVKQRLILFPVNSAQKGENRVEKRVLESISGSFLGTVLGS